MRTIEEFYTKLEELRPSLKDWNFKHLIIIDNIEVLKELVTKYWNYKFEIGHSWKNEPVYHTCTFWDYSNNTKFIVGIKGDFHAIMGYIYSDSLYKEYQNKVEGEKYYTYEHLIPKSLIPEPVNQHQEFIDIFNKNLDNNLKRIHEYSNKEFCFIFTSSGIIDILPENRLLYLFKCLNCENNLSYTELMLKDKKLEQYFKPFLFKVYDKRNRPNEMFEVNMLDDEPGMIKPQDIV
jgi:hypothetical protein